MKKKVIVVIIFFLCFWPFNTSAQSNGGLVIKIFDAQTLNFKRSFLISLGSAYRVNISLVDLGGDGQKEIIVSSAGGDEPWIKIYSGWGDEINQFLAYDKGFQGEVSVSVGDLNGDAREEIIVGAGQGGGPHIRILDGFGKAKINPGFFAGDKNDLKGVKISLADVDGDEKLEIITWLASQNKIKIFKINGELKKEFAIQNIDKISEIKTFNFDSERGDEIIISAAYQRKPLVQVYRANGELIQEFYAYHPYFGGGVNFEIMGEEIITGAGISGTSHIRFFNFEGDDNRQKDFFAFDQSYKGGVKVAVGDVDGDGRQELVTLTQSKRTGNDKYDKYIEIDIGEQFLSYYHFGYLIDRGSISSGMRNYPTPLGEFKVLNKDKLAYSKKYNLYMPHWLGFTHSGAGIHGLPYWKYDWGIVYEGVGHLGSRVSHGCVRLALDFAQELYNWAQVGTKVIVHE